MLIDIYPASLEALCQSLGIERSISQKERDAIDDSDFAGPHNSFPIDTQAHLDAAAHLIGHADDPEAVKAKAIEIAKRKGLKLPEAWQEDEKKDSQERAVEGSDPQANDQGLERDWAAYDAAHGHQGKHNHGSHQGKHTHTHSHNSHTHSHEHSHNHDHSHDHTHNQARALPDGILALDGYTPHMSFPIIRSNPKDRTVYGRATVEEPDRHGTIFSYEGAKGAFARWKGNIREQHDIKKAVGKRVDYEFNDDEKGVYLLARVSKGAPDTWEKVIDGTLSDFSVNVIPAAQYGTDPRRWPKKEHNGKMYPYLPEYDYAEISLVDSGSAPGAQFMPIVRADGSPTELLAVIEDEPTTPEPEPTPEPQTLERAGARMSSDTQAKMHQSIGHTLRAASTMMQNCGCEDCAAAMQHIDPDGDGDVDLGGYDDPDHDWKSLYGNNQTTNDDMERAVIGIVERALQPVFARLQGIAGSLARGNAPSTNTSSIENIVSGAITRAVEAANAAHESSLTEVRASLGAVKEQVDAIANTPMPGAPVMNAGALPRPVEKRLATDPYARPQSSGSSVYDAVAALSNSGHLDSVDKQVDAVAAALAAQRRGY